MRKAWVVRRAPQYFSKILRISSRSRKAVEHRRDRADIERVRAQPQQVARDPVQLRQNHADDLRPRRRLHIQQLLDRQAIAQAVRDRRHVIHAVDVGIELRVGAVLGDLLHAAVQVADDASVPSTFSPSSLRMTRSTPCVDGCCGPMLRTSSVESRNVCLADLEVHMGSHWPLSIPRFSCTQRSSCWRMP